MDKHTRNKKMLEDLNRSMERARGDSGGAKAHYESSSIDNTSMLEKLSSIKDNRNSINIVMPKSKASDAPKYNTPNNSKKSLAKIMQDIVSPLIDRATRKSGSSRDMVDTSIMANSLLGEATQVHSQNKIDPVEMKSVKSLLKDHGKIAYFDTETLGGTNSSGQREILDITDLSYKKATLGDNGEVLEQESKKFFWGITGEDFNDGGKTKNYYERIASDFADGAPIETNKDKITLERLALFGNKKTKIENHEIIDFATKDDLKSGITQEDVNRGLKRLKEEQTYQLQNMENGLKPWEREFVDIIKDTVMDKETVIAGNNIIGFDIPAMKQFANNNLGEEAKKELDSILSGQSVNELLKGRQLDALPLLREAFGDNVNGLYTKEQLAEISKNGTSAFQLESLKSVLPDHLKEGDKSHTSDFDVEVGLGFLLTPLEQLNTTQKFQSEYRGNRNMMDILLNKGSANAEEASTLKQGQILLSNKSVSADNYRWSNVLAFSTNDLEKTIKAPDKFIMNPDGSTTERGFGNWPIGKGLTYELQDYGYIDIDKDIKEALSPYSMFDGEQELYYAVMNSNLDPESLGVKKGSAAENLYKESGVILGTKDSVEKAMNDFEVISEDGRNFTDKAEQTLSIITPDGQSTPLKELNDVSVQSYSDKLWGEKIQDRSRRSINKTDNHNYIEKVMDILDDESKFVAEAAEKGISKSDARERFMEDMLASVKELADNKSAGKELGFESQEGTQNAFKKYFGYDVAQESMRNLHTSLDFYRDNREFYSNILEVTKETYPNDRKSQGHLYEHIASNIHELVIESMSTTRESINSFEDNFYEIDLRDTGLSMFKGLSDDESILRMNLDRDHYGFFDSAAKLAGRNFKTTAEEDAFNRRLVPAILKTEGVNHEDFLTISEAMEDGASLKTQIGAVRKAFTTKKEKDPASAYKKEWTTFDKNKIIEDVISDHGADSKALIESIASGAPTFIPIGQSKSSIENLANKITDATFHVATTGDNNIGVELANKGLDTDTAKSILLGERIRKKESLNIYGSLIESAQKHGIDLAFDENSNTISILPGSGKDSIPLPQLPQRTYKDGLLSTRVGNMYLSSPLSLDFTNGGSEIKIGSNISKAQDAAGNINSYIHNAINGRLKGETKEDAMVRGVNSYTKKLAENLRESGAIMYSSSKEIQSIEQFDVSNIVPLIKNFKDIDYNFDNAVLGDQVDKYTGNNYREILEATISKIQTSDRVQDLSDLSDTEANIIGINMNVVLEGLSNKATSDQQRFFDYLSKSVSPDNYGNQVKDFMFSLGDFTTATQVLEKTNRGIDYQSRHAIPITPARKALLKSNEKLSDIGFGRIIETEYESSVTDRALTALGGQKTDDVARIQALYMDDSSFHSTISKYLDKDSISPIAQRRISNLTLLEGAGIVDPRMVDSLYPNRTSVQKINETIVANKEEMLKTMADVKDAENTVQKEFSKRARLAPQMSIGKDGLISFKYGDSEYVHNGGDLITINQMDGTQMLTSGSDGFLRYGFFDRTLAVGGAMSEEEVTDYLNSNIGLLREHSESLGQNTPTLETTLDFLSTVREGGAQVFDAKYYVEELEAINISKYIEGLEKNMAIAPRLGLGQNDERVSKVLESLDLGDYKGKVLDIDLINELGSESKISEIALGKIYKTETGKVLTDEVFKEALGSAELGTREELLEAIIGERYASWDAMGEALESAGIDTSGVRYLTDNMEERIKHGNISPLMESIFLSMKEDGHSGDEIAAKMNEVIYEIDDSESRTSRELISYDQSKDRLILDANKDTHTAIDKESLISLKEETSGGVHQVTKDGHQFIKDRTTISRAIDPDRAKKTKQSLIDNPTTQRDMNPHFADWLGVRSMMLTKHDEEVVNHMIDNFGEEEAIKQFGDVAKISGGKSQIRDKYINTSIASEIKSNLDRNILYDAASGPSDSLLVSNGKVMEDVAHNTLNKFELNFLKEAQQELNLEDVSTSKFEEFMSRFYASQAHSFNDAMLNSGDVEGRKQALLESGFKELSIDELILSKETGEFENNINTANNLIVKLDGGYLSPSDLPGSHIAMPAYTEKFVGESEITTDPQKKLYALTNSVQRYNTMMDPDSGYDFGGVDKKAAIERQKDSIAKNYNNLHQSVLEANRGKKGQHAQFDRFNFTYGQTAKATMSDIYSDDMPGGDGDLKFEGHALKDLYGKHDSPLSFVTVPETFFDDQYYESLEDFGISSEDIKNRLQTEGSIGTSKRNPEVYLTSYSPTAVYVDPSLSKDEMRGSLQAFLAKKADSDGDQIEASILDAKVKVQYMDGDSVAESYLNLDHARYEMLASRMGDSENPLTMNIGGEDRIVSSVDLVDEKMFKRTKQKMWADANTYRMYGSNYETPEGPTVNDISEVTSAILDGRQEGPLVTSQLVSEEASVVRMTGKLNKRNAGIINTLVTDIRSYTVMEETNTSNQEAKSMSQFLTALEEGYLSPKHADQEMLGRLTELGHLRDVIGGATAPGDRKNLSGVEEFFRESLWDSKEVNILTDMSDDQKEEMLDDVMNVFSRMDVTRDVKEAKKLGKSTTMNPTYNRVQHALVSEQIKVSQSFALLDKKIDPGLNIKEARLEGSKVAEALRSNAEDGRATAAELTNDWQSSTRASTGTFSKVAKETGEQFVKNASGMDPRMLAVAGMAGAFMMAGFVGGNPSEPAQQHAEEIQNEEYSQEPTYVSNSLGDANLAMTQNPQQGYVINVRAESNKNKKQLEKIINTSFAASYPTNLNIQMNMHDRGGNITDREIEKIISRAIG